MVSTAHKGFTLVEMLIVVAIIGILAGIAFPSYSRYIIEGKRADMMAEMQQMASRIEANKITYKRYDRIPFNEIYAPGATITSGTSTFPIADTPLYTVSLSPITATTLSGPDWTITATPITGGQMANDGTLTLDNTGRRCRNVTISDRRCGVSDEWRR